MVTLAEEKQAEEKALEEKAKAEKAARRKAKARAKETQALMVDRIKRGDFFFQLGSLGDLGFREVQLYAKGHDGNTMLIGVPENVLASWVLLADAQAEGFSEGLDLEKARRAFEPQVSGFRALVEAAEMEVSEAEESSGLLPKADFLPPLLPGLDTDDNDPKVEDGPDA